jgi:processing peptidase subunit beta
MMRSLLRMSNNALFVFDLAFQVRIRDDDMEKVSFAVAVQGASWTDPDSVPLMVMQNMLGTWSKALGQGKHAG